MNKRFTILIGSIIFLSTSLFGDGWLPLFNGKDLSGWTIKVARHPLGENFANTWRVEDGIIKVDHSDYQDFNMQVSHLYSNQAYSHYRLRLDYMFVDGHREDAPFWAVLNSGVMLHSQSPQSMELDQAFPVSIEAQFLAEGTKAGTQTGNVASPGTHIERDGKLITDHIVDSKSTLYPLDEWVHFEIEVHGDREIIYFVNGEEVHRFQHPQLDPEDKDSKRLIGAGATVALRHGHIALQAEGQNVWFRNVDIKPLEEQ